MHLHYNQVIAKSIGENLTYCYVVYFDQLLDACAPKIWLKYVFAIFWQFFIVFSAENKKKGKNELKNLNMGHPLRESNRVWVLTSYWDTVFQLLFFIILVQKLKIFKIILLNSYIKFSEKTGCYLETLSIKYSNTNHWKQEKKIWLGFGCTSTQKLVEIHNTVWQIWSSNFDLNALL